MLGHIPKASDQNVSRTSRKTMKVYVDDMPVKSRQAGDHIQHLIDTFHILRKFNMKLNPEKCIKAIEEIPDMLTIKKEVQRLSGRITTLGRFISRSSKKCFKFFSSLQKQNQFEWSKECQQALKDLKAYLSNPPLLAKSKEGEKLLVNLAISQVAIPREENVEANALANLASAAEVTNEENASVIHLFHSVLDQDKNELNYNDLTWDWRNEIVNFLQYGILLEDNKKAQALHQKAARYCLNQGNLYRKMFGGPLARCLGPSQTEYMMREIHEGHCGNHAGGRSLKRLEESKDKWPEVLLGVLWAYRTTAKTSTGEILFSLVYGAEALIPVEIGEPSTKYTQATKESNEEEMRVNLDLLEERRETALIKVATQKQVIERYYNRKARLEYFKIGDYVLKKVFQSTRAANARKLSPNWEGPYKIHGIAGKGAYKLEILDGKILPSNLNVVHLKKYYF
uniref:Uncharacterized protein LOC104242696 n=1 Tax=Nicotiana sylvestris TaxID=4096 RepID=A0A1U7YBA4_NICSY|nr:PREDICTED: uncharacterized protein LOC104242696 [Nicotiana sylvestris]